MEASGAGIVSLIQESPADDAGFLPGYRIVSVDGQPLRDMIDWQWLTDDESIHLTYLDPQGQPGEVTLERELGEPWGFEFDGVIFDGIKTCRNACTFCFMRQLPDGMRPSLSLRDDDFRLSFLTGTFATFTNLTPEDETRILEQHISPLRVSLHAITPEVRALLIGKHAPHGLEAAKRLLAAGITMHIQIVLVPGVSDGEELRCTLAWAYEQPGVLSVGVVPLGFTKHQSIFTKSFNNPEDAQTVLADIAPFQARAQQERGHAWVYAADEFYRNAYPAALLEKLPSAAHYGDYEMFEDGIGIIRSTVDSWEASTQAIQDLAEQLERHSMRVHYVIGRAQEAFLVPLVQASPLRQGFIPYAVDNAFFGGNVDVTGLLCGCDIVAALKQSPAAGDDVQLVCVPRVIFNDEGLTLDGMSLEDMQKQLSCPLAVVSCNPSDYIDEIRALITTL